MARIASICTVCCVLCTVISTLGEEPLVASFVKARNDLARRDVLIEQAIEAGGIVPAQLLRILNQELRPKVKSYRNSFGKAALAIERKRSRVIDAATVSQLRSTVLDLGRKPDLTHEMLVATADPAIQQLASILLLDRETVGQSSPSLGKQRTELAAAGKLWEKCATAAADLAAKTDKRPMSPTFENILKAEEDFALLMVSPLDSATRAVLLANARLAEQLDTEEARAIAQLNLTRNLLGLSALAFDPLLCRAARDHSQDMEAKNFFSHESPVAGKKTPWDRAALHGTSASAENIAVGMTQGTAANDLWFHSPGHHRNMLGEHARIGVGRSGVHWTQMFGN